MTRREHVREILREDPSLTMAAIAARLGVSVETVRHPFSMARKALGINVRLSPKYVQARGAAPTPPPQRSTKPSEDDREIPENVGTLIDTGEPINTKDRVTSIVTPDRPMTLDELAEAAGIDRKVWVATNYKCGHWQGFYRKRTDWASGKPMEGHEHAHGLKLATKGHAESKHEKVALFKASVTWVRIMDRLVESMLRDWFLEHARPIEKKDLPKHFVGKRCADEKDGQLVVWGLWDAHLGLYTWAPEVGANTDLSSAIERIENSIDDMCYELCDYKIAKIVMPIGNDFLHFDNARQKTTNGEHHLDGDTRYAKVYMAGLRCLIYMVERALEITDRIEILFVPGNHDAQSAFTLCLALAQRFIHDERVTFRIDPNKRKYVTFGGCIIGFDHGEGANARQLANIFSNEAKQHWTDSTYREVQKGHIHQRRVEEFESSTPTNGVTITTNPALCNVDVWHHGQGLIGEPMKSVEAWRYDRTARRGSHVTWAREGANGGSRAIVLAREA